ncbi:MAG: DUF86 domain-containing protein [Bacteroidetes bacterium]|nr:DUF86 domain-containing protein [Bacteroidota bacterium]
MRDKLTHSYADVNYKIVWEVSLNEIPEIKTSIEKLL